MLEEIKKCQKKSKGNPKELPGKISVESRQDFSFFGDFSLQILRGVYRHDLETHLLNGKVKRANITVCNLGLK